MYRQCVMMNGFSIDKCWFSLLPTGMNKPQHALWTSTYKDNPSEIGWVEWVYYNMPEWIQNELYLIIPKQSTKVYTIDSLEDYKSKELIKLPEDNNVYLKHQINYQAMANKGYDGINFTSHGAALGHMFSFENKEDMDISLALNSIDCESTVWFNIDWISSVGRITNTFKEDIKLYMEAEEY